MIVVDCSGRYLPSPAAEAHAAAILHAGCLGTEAGTAVARVLLGHAYPSGKLPMTIPRSTGQIPLYYNRKTVGKTVTFVDRYRGYEDQLLTPLYRFGYGLGYTTFTLANQQLSAATMSADGAVTLRATLTNTGARAGAEVVQFYICDPVASTSRPGRELKGFQRVELAPGASRVVTFKITAAELEFYGARFHWEVEPGEFRLGLGFDSAAPLPLTLTVMAS